MKDWPVAEESGWLAGHPVSTPSCGSEEDPWSSGRGSLGPRDSVPGRAEGGREGERAVKPLKKDPLKRA